MIRIRTDNLCPPIPWRKYDWCAYDDSLGADSSPVGYGATEEEAIADLLDDMGVTLRALTLVGANIAYAEIAEMPE